MGDILDEGPYCICRGPDDGTPMVACDNCDEWYHLSCIGIDYEDASGSAQYYCRRCRTLSGQVEESDEEESEEEVEEEEEEASSSAESVSESEGRTSKGTKPAAVRQRQSNTAKSRRDRSKESSSRKRSREETKRGTAAAPSTKKQKPAVDEKMRQYVRTSLTSVFSGTDVLDLERGQALAGEVELALYAFYANDSQAHRNYATKFRSLYFNLKDPNNYDALLKRIVLGSLTPNDLVAMSPADLANPMLVLQREAAEKAALARVLKTGDSDEDAPGRVGVYGFAGGKDNDEPRAPQKELKSSEAVASSASETQPSTAVVTKPLPVEDNMSTGSVGVDPNTIGSIAMPSLSDFAVEGPEPDDGEDAGADDYGVLAPPRTPDIDGGVLPSDAQPADELCALGYPSPVWTGVIRSAAVGRVRSHLLHLGGPPVEGASGAPSSSGEDTLAQVGRMPLSKLHKYLSDIAATSTTRCLSVALMVPYVSTDSDAAHETVAGRPRSIYASAKQADQKLFDRFFASLHDAQRAAVMKCEADGDITEAFVVPLPKPAERSDGTFLSYVPNWAVSAIDPAFIGVTPQLDPGSGSDLADPRQAYFSENVLLCAFLSHRPPKRVRAIKKLMSAERDALDAGISERQSLGSRKRLRLLGVSKAESASAEATAKASSTSARSASAAARPLSALPQASSDASRLLASLSQSFQVSSGVNAAGAASIPGAPVPASASSNVNRPNSAAASLLSHLKSLAATGYQGAPAASAWNGQSSGPAQLQQQQQQQYTHQPPYGLGPNGYPSQPGGLPPGPAQPYTSNTERRWDGRRESRGNDGSRRRNDAPW